MLWTPLNFDSGNSFPENTYLSFHPLLCYSRHWKHIRKVYVMFKASSGSFRCRKSQTGLLNHLIYQNTSWRGAPNYLELSVLVWAWTDEDYTKPNCPFTPPLHWYNITNFNTTKQQMSRSEDQRAEGSTNFKWSVGTIVGRGRKRKHRIQGG